jgi:hypothetical protein
VASRERARLAVPAARQPINPPISTLSMRIANRKQVGPSKLPYWGTRSESGDVAPKHAFQYGTIQSNQWESKLKMEGTRCKCHGAL